MIYLIAIIMNDAVHIEYVICNKIIIGVVYLIIIIMIWVLYGLLVEQVLLTM